MSNNTQSNPSSKVDTTMADTEGTNAPPGVIAPANMVKAEPVDDDDTTMETPQLPHITPPPTNGLDYPPLPGLGSSTLDEEDLTTVGLTTMDESFEQSMAEAQREFNRRSLPEDTPPNDEDYDEAVCAVEKKRTEIAKRESMNIGTMTDRIELQRLEDALLLAQKNKIRSERHAKNEREQSSMFFSEGETSDGDENTPSQAPARRGFPNLYEDLMTLDTSEEVQIQTKEEIKAGKKRKYVRKTSATSKAAKKPKTTRHGPRTQVEMLNMGSLIRNDLVADARANQGLRNQPALGGETRNRKNALEALLASIPEQERDMARSEKATLDKACKVFGRRIKPDGDDGWKLKGMASSLKHFQLLSVAKGVEKERGSAAPYGGMLADTMGYGKTIQMIAIMVENKPDITAKNKTTLIVVPGSITSQWLEEIAKHVEDGIMEDVFIYKSGCRPADHETIRFFRRQQVVITTYHEVMRHYPKCEPPIHLATEAAKDAWWSKYYDDNCGPLLQMKFHRVILDEAQTIKNHDSRTSKACRQLSAKYKWVLTGTPLSNRKEELFPYFHFLGVEGSNTYPLFQHNYAKRNDLTMKRLDAILRKVMIRRTGSSRLFGAPLVSLPALDYQTIEIPFNAVEKAIYSVVRERFMRRVCDWNRSNNVNQISKNIFVMLTRLRQMCAHVLMIGTTIRDLLETEDIEKLWRCIERHSTSINSNNRKTATMFRNILREARDERVQVEATPPPGSEIHNGDTFDLTIDDGYFDFRGFFYQLQKDGQYEKIKGRSLCGNCREVPEGEQCRLSDPCNHFFCEVCITDLLQVAKDEKREAFCPTCQNPMTGAKDSHAMNQIANEARQTRIRASAREPAAPKKKGRKNKEDPELAWLKKDGAERLSSKAQAVEATIAEWIENDPDAKIVVFTLWIPMIKVIGKICQRRGWGSVEYTGTISADARNQNLAKFKDPANDIPILLMSLRTGGVGLNIVEASYCCMVDPWWNEPTEGQAYSRVYRIGQPKKCIVRRFLIKDAIDTQLMLYLQKIKAQECDRVIDGRTNDKLCIKDLMKLFGPSKKDGQTGRHTTEGRAGDTNDDFIMGSESIVIEDSDDERVMPAPARPREK